VADFPATVVQLIARVCNRLHKRFSVICEHVFTHSCTRYERAFVSKRLDTFESTRVDTFLCVCAETPGRINLETRISKLSAFMSRGDATQDGRK